MPFAPRATVFVIAFAVVAAVVGGGCGGDREAGGFCAQITRGHAAFDSIDVARSSRALAMFDRIAATAPPTIAPDLKTVSSVVSLLYNNPKALLKEPANFQHFVEARNRVDQYLRRSCGAPIPRSKSR